MASRLHKVMLWLILDSVVIIEYDEEKEKYKEK
jgi:hypothetical protein